MNIKKIVLMAAVVAATASCARKNPFLTEWNTPNGVPPFSEIETSDYMPALKVALDEYKSEIQAIASQSEAPTFENAIAPFELGGRLLSKVAGVLYNLEETDGTPEMMAVMEEAQPLMTACDDEIFMDPQLFDRVRVVYENASGLTKEQQMVVKKLYDRFVANGVALDAAGQERFRAINQELAGLTQKFGNNLLAENNAFAEKFGTTVSDYQAEMTVCPDRERREQLFKAYSSRGANGGENDNCLVLLQILKLRAEKAQMLGFANSADYTLQNKMAKDHGTVDAFLSKIIAPAVAKAKVELADMQKVMDEDVAAGLLPAGSEVEPWDWFYYSERVRKAKYDLDESQTKPYFQADSVLKGVFYAAEKIYGVKMTPAPELPVWHPEVRGYELHDADGSLLGVFYTDYFSRSTKRGGAWMNNFRDQLVDASGKDVRPVIVNVCNFPPATDSLPSLLTIDNVETAFHEFGHALHGLLTKCHYPSVSGTSVARDFVETFSQFNENWAFQPEILGVYAHDYRTGELIPAELVAKIGNSRKFNQGFATTELCAASILDMKWHELSLSELESLKTREDIEAFEAKVCKEMGLIDEIIPRYRSSYFAHIFSGGYYAGYYSYLWAEVLVKDAWEYFEERGIYDPAVAQEFRTGLMERGGSDDPMALYVAFRGSEPDPGALLRARGLE